MAQKRIYTHNEVIDTLVGVKGTAQREAYDLSIELFLVGQTIREIREKRNLTQEDLGNLIGVKKAQISRIENGKESDNRHDSQSIQSARCRCQTAYIGSLIGVELTAFG